MEPLKRRLLTLKDNNSNRRRASSVSLIHKSKQVFIPHDILNVWILSVILSLAAGIFPAWKASRLSPLEALRR